jgi:hypothetical protein
LLASYGTRRRRLRRRDRVPDHGIRAPATMRGGNGALRERARACPTCSPQAIPEVRCPTPDRRAR